MKGAFLRNYMACLVGFWRWRVWMLSLGEEEEVGSKGRGGDEKKEE